MTQNEGTVKALRDLEEWILFMQKKSKSGTLNDNELKLLLKIRDLAKGINPVVTPVPKSNPIPKKAPVYYMEMGFADLFAGLDAKIDLMSSEHLFSYNKLRRLFEEDHTGISLPFDAIDFLRRAYGCYCFRRL